MESKVTVEQFLGMNPEERKAMPFKESGRLYAELMAANLREKTRDIEEPQMTSASNRLHTSMILRAASFAAHKHRNQRRKDADASPYINHPLGLARILAEEGGITHTVTLYAALLHDTIEDTDTTREELSQEFGEDVAVVVMEVTDDKNMPKSERKRLQIEHAAHISDRAKRVKLADKISNIRDVAASPPADWPLKRRQEYFDWARAVIDALRGIDARLEAVFDEAYAARP